MRQTAAKHSASFTSRAHLELALAVPTENNNYLRVEVYYDLGGNNAFTQRPEQRGVYLSATPEHLSDGMSRITLFSGLKHLLEPARRLNRATVKKHWELLTEQLEARTGDYWEFIDDFLVREHLELADPQPPPVERAWLTPDVCRLVTTWKGGPDLALCPILADALEERGQAPLLQTMLRATPAQQAVAMAAFTRHRIRE